MILVCVSLRDFILCVLHMPFHWRDNDVSICTCESGKIR